MEVRAYSPRPMLADAELSQGLESVDSSASFSKQESFSSSASNSPQKSLSSVSSGSPHRFHSRTINYMVANNDGFVEAGAEEFTFKFQGTSVEQLTLKLEEETELGHIIVCSRNPVNGKLCPLRLQLPPNKNTMNVVVLLASSKAAKGFEKQQNPL